MRLLMLITDLERGGTPTVVRELATRLRDDHIAVEVACLAPWGPVADELRARGIRVTAFGASSVFSLLATRRRLLRLIEQGRFDVVLSFLVHANALAASVVNRFPSVRWLQSIQTTQPRPRWHWLVQRWAARSAQRIIVPSPSIAAAAQRRSRIPANKISIIPNAVDPDDFEGIHRDPARPVAAIGFLGRLDPVKRVQDVIRAMQHLDPSLRLSIFGDGPERIALSKIVEAHHLTGRVSFKGMVDSPQIALSQIDLLMLPSQAEGMPMVLIEAMAAGVPVVATNAPGIRDVIIHESTGLLVPVANPPALADAITRLGGDPDLRRRLVGQAANSVRQLYSWTAVLPMYKSLLSSLT